MITSKKLTIYNKYEGDIDGWARVSSKNERTEMEDADWYLIETLLQAFCRQLKPIKDISLMVSTAA